MSRDGVSDLWQSRCSGVQLLESDGPLQFGALSGIPRDRRLLRRGEIGMFMLPVGINLHEDTFITISAPIEPIRDELKHAWS